MKNIRLSVFVFVMVLLAAGCSKKSHPSSGMDTSAVTKKDYERKTAKANFPRVISVNDSAAQKSVDGRLYYDVMGHRYWRNYKDGKYYLFNKSMYTDPAFKKPHK